MIKYPDVLDEFSTMQQIVSGRSIARYGDGEFKMAAHGAGIKSQRSVPELNRRLAQILHNPGDCLVGIPNIHGVVRASSQQKIEFWKKQAKFAVLLNPKVEYVSSLISRPDSAPWINTPEYWSLVESLWVGQAVTVVRGSGKSLAPVDLEGAGEVTDILCRPQHAFQDYDEILKRIGTPKRALICLGPTATLLAVDLCRRGVHAIDLGHIAMFLRRVRRGQPMVDEEALEPVA